MNITKKDNSITLEFTEDEMVILADSLINPLDHFETVAIEKLANCKSRLLRNWLSKLQETKTVSSIPTDDTELISLIISQPDYKNRVDSEISILDSPGDSRLLFSS